MKTMNDFLKAVRGTAFLRYNAGFTLVELIVVIAVIAILAGTVTVTMTNSYRDSQLVNAVAMSLSDLRYAQEMATTRRQSVDFSVDAGTNTYEAYWTGTTNHIQSPATGNDLIVTFGTGMYGGISISSSGLGGVLRFGSDGKPTIAGTDISTDLEVLKLNGRYQIIIEPSGYSYTNDSGGGGGCSS